MNQPAPDELLPLRQLSHLESRARTSACLDEIDIADFVDGLLVGEARDRALAHMVACEHCRSSASATAALVVDDAITRELPGRGPKWRMWPAALAGLAAAAAIVLLVPVRDEPGTLREPAITSTIAPAAIEPRGVVRGVERLIWSSVPGSERYRVRVYNADGTTRWAGQTTDTSIAIPDTVRFVAGEGHAWRVEAETEWRRWVASELTQFEVEPR